MSILCKGTYRFSAIPIKIPMTFFTELEQTILKFVLEPQKMPNSQSNLEKEEQSWKHHTSQFQTIFKTIAIKTVWYWHKSRQINGTEERAQK